MPSSDDYAREVIRAGRDMGVSPRGIVIGLATCIVEVGYPLRMYANRKVPESLLLPHDAVGDDGYSVGLFQQQIRRGSSGEWWWADCATCMNPYKSARLFFERLVKRDYDRGDPGAHAQAVQGSAFPDRYGQRMGEAQRLYDRLSGGSVSTYYDSDRSAEFGFGGPRPISGLRGVCIHTTESGKSATATARTADDVTTYQATSQTGSYNVMVGVDGKRILQNTDDWQTWSTGNKGNDILLHVCVVGNASQSRAEWLAQDKMLRAVGSVVGHWCRLYGWPIKKVDAAHLPGVLGHVDTRVWGGTDHTDPGPNFPYDVVLAYAQGAPTDEEIDMASAADLERKLDLILDQIGPKLPGWGPQSSFGKDAQGRELTLRDGVIAKLDRMQADIDAIRKAVTK